MSSGCLLLDQQVPAGAVQALQWMGQGEQLTESGREEENTTANPWLPQTCSGGEQESPGADAECTQHSQEPSSLPWDREDGFHLSQCV